MMDRETRTWADDQFDQLVRDLLGSKVRDGEVVRGINAAIANAEAMAAEMGDIWRVHAKEEIALMRRLRGTHDKLARAEVYRELALLKWHTSIQVALLSSDGAQRFCYPIDLEGADEFTKRCASRLDDRIAYVAEELATPQLMRVGEELEAYNVGELKIVHGRWYMLYLLYHLGGSGFGVLSIQAVPAQLTRAKHCAFNARIWGSASRGINDVRSPEARRARMTERMGIALTDRFSSQTFAGVEPDMMISRSWKPRERDVVKRDDGRDELQCQGGDDYIFGSVSEQLLVGMNNSPGRIRPVGPPQPDAPYPRHFIKLGRGHHNWLVVGIEPMSPLVLPSGSIATSQSVYIGRWRYGRGGFEYYMSCEAKQEALALGAAYAGQPSLDVGGKTFYLERTSLDARGCKWLTREEDGDEQAHQITS